MTTDDHGFPQMRGLVDLWESVSAKRICAHLCSIGPARFRMRNYPFGGVSKYATRSAISSTVTVASRPSGMSDCPKPFIEAT